MIRRSLRWIIPTLLLICVAMSASEAQEAVIYTTGNDLVEYMRDYDKCDKDEKGASFFHCGMFMGYVCGIQDATGEMYSIPKGVQRGQLAVVVSKFLKDHPERWSESAVFLVTDALKEAFPITKVK